MGRMKIKPEDYKRLKAAVFEFLKNDDAILTAKVGFVNDINMARRWIIFHQVNKPTPEGFPFRFDYLKDNHIDSALKSIIREWEA